MRTTVILSFVMLLSWGRTSFAFPNLLGENLPLPPISSLGPRIDQVITHQNMLRASQNLPLLQGPSAPLALDEKGRVKIFDVSRRSIVSILNRGQFAFIHKFDDAEFLNHVYVFDGDNRLLRPVPLAQFAVENSAGPFVSVFRLMDAHEAKLWVTKDIQKLRAWPGLPGPPTMRYWGYRGPVTHTSAYVPWERGRIGNEPCLEWRIGKGLLREWAIQKKVSFGLTGPIDSKEYEFVFLDSTWDAFMKLTPLSCER